MERIASTSPLLPPLPPCHDNRELINKSTIQWSNADVIQGMLQLVLFGEYVFRFFLCEDRGGLMCSDSRTSRLRNGDRYIRRWCYLSFWLKMGRRGLLTMRGLILLPSRFCETFTISTRKQRIRESMVTQPPPFPFYPGFLPDILPQFTEALFFVTMAVCCLCANDSS